MALRFHHVGYAVASIPDYVDEFLAPLVDPVEVGPTIEDPLQGVRVAFVTVTGGVVIELIEPMSDSSPVSKYLGDRRGGLYHVCYETDALEATIETFRSKRCMLFSGPSPAAAFDGRRIAFLFTPQRDIIELVEGSSAG